MSLLPLPSGLPDVLPPYAAQEFRVIYHMLRTFTKFGYQPVIPPLMEYESSLLADQGAATSRQAFRLMDPLSREMLALRADITTQISRIAESSLKQEARPLRLSYAGYTLRTAPESLRTRRQHTQIGIELFGANNIEFDAEVIAIPLEALQDLSLSNLSLDISVPALLEELIAEHTEQDKNTIREAVSRKDSSALRANNATFIADIVDTSGSTDSALALLKILAERTQSSPLSKAVSEVTLLLASLSKRGVKIPTTLDILETRGFSYYSGIAFSLFLCEPALEIGRGGHYTCKNGEEAVGFTFYIDDILAALGTPEEPKKIGISGHSSMADLRAWHTKGFETILLYSNALKQEAKALGCSHLHIEGTTIELTSK